MKESSAAEVGRWADDKDGSRIHAMYMHPNTAGNGISEYAGDDTSILQEQADTTSGSWRALLRASWIRNKGLVYVMLSQLFGASMNMLTQGLEMDGPHGKAMHPFQVSPQAARTPRWKKKGRAVNNII